MCSINTNLVFGKVTQQATLRIITLVERVSKTLDTGKYVVGVFLDLKTLDTVDQGILLKKLYLYGIRGNIYSWFESYLTNRSQYGEYNNVKSKTDFITQGVPHGSILGPLIFNIYKIDFSRSSELLYSILFAKFDKCLKHADWRFIHQMIQVNHIHFFSYYCEYSF